jgi:hypothetical protein
MDAVNGKHSSSRLSWVGYTWLGLAVLLVAAGMGIAFWYSFTNLKAGAAAHGMRPPFLLPLVVDTAVPAYVIIDQMIVALGWRSHLPRLAAWGFAVLTVFLNGAVSADPSPLWRVVHAAMPAAWIIGIECLRLLWRVLRKGEHRKGIPLSRWVLARKDTWELWKRMKLWDIADYSEAVRMELRRAVAIRSLDVFYRPRDWRLAAPADLVLRLERGVFMDEAIAMVAELTAVAEPVATSALPARKPRRSTPRKGRGATARKQPAGKVPATALSPEAAGMDIGTEALILKYIGEGKSASEAGRLAGVTDSRGRQVARKLAESAPATGEQPPVA